MKKILIIMNDKKRQQYLRSLLTRCNVFPAYSGKSGLYRAKNISPALILVDIHLPDISGFEVLEQLHQYTPSPPPPVIVYTSFSHTKNVVKAMKYGAKDFLRTDYPDNELQKYVDTYVAVKEGKDENQTGNDPFFPELNTLIGTDSKIITIKETIASISEFDIPVLVTGETGTGKELVAKLIHQTSKQKTGPFKVMNAAGIPATLLESELFGTVAGAFTDAKNRTGLFEQAHDGTLFIDEIGDMPPAYQVKILRVLENKEIKKLGSDKPDYVTVRFISATNQDLGKLIKNNTFRLDLFYRINGISIEIPPLRKRKDDIPLMVEKFMAPVQKKLNSPALEKLQSHNWPGNVRELKQTLKLSVINAKKKHTVGPEHIAFLRH